MSAINPAVKPTAPITELSRPYWEAAAQGQLVLQQCSACGTVRHYPRLLCTQCFSDVVVWKFSRLFNAIV